MQTMQNNLVYKTDVEMLPSKNSNLDQNSSPKQENNKNEKNELLKQQEVKFSLFEVRYII